MKKRVISLFMAFCMVFTMLPTAAFATTANDTLAALDSGVSSTLDSGATSDEVISLCRLYLLARHAAEQPDATEEQQTRLERLEENFEKAFSPIRARYEEYTELSSAEREDETVLAEYADVIELYRAVDRMLSGDYDCTCGQRCTEEEHSDDCLRCVIDGIDNCAAAQTLLKTMSAAEATEQFSLRTGKTYYFDLSSEKANLGATPTIYDRHIDPSLHYVPFTYVGTINAYSLENSDIGTATTEARAAERLYEHSLFVAEYPISNKMSWELLKTRSYVFGKEFGTNYILRSLSVGSDQREPATNEWDVILEKDSASIKYADRGLATMGQDTNTYDNGYYTLRGRNDVYDYNGLPFNLASDGSTEAFRPALEVTWEGELDENLLKEVTLKLNGGMAFYETNDLSIVCTGDTFIAPASDIFLKDYQPVTDFHWLGSDNKAYAVGDEVPSTVTSLTAQWSVMPAATGQVWNGTSAKYFDGGTGTEADPYQIRTAEQFALLADVINGGESKIVTEGGVSQTYAFLQSACYKQTADIVLNDTADWQDWDAAPPTNSWKPIGTSYKYFSGAFDGDGFTVSGAFFKDETLYLWNGNNGGSFTGLFGYAKDATIKNVTVAESFIKGYERVGGLVGYVGGNGIVENCQNYGTVEGQSQVGGMVGNNDCTVQSLQNYGSVNGYLYVGGVVGGNSGLLKESQNHGAVSGEGSIGGVAGNNMEADAQILDCINAGAVSGTAEYGGVVGIFNKGSVTNSRSPVGLVQDATGDVGVPNLPSSEHYCIGHIIGRGTNGTGNSSDKIEAGVAITPGAVIVAKGGTQQFVANAEAAVTWSVLNDDAQVSIDEDGKLTLTADAADGTIYVVKAMLDDDNTKFGTATVTVESSPSYEAAWGLAKADGAAPDSWVGTGTLVDAMNYAMYLYSGTAYIRLFTDVDTTATIDIPFNKTTILDLNGYTIDAKQGAFSVLSVRGDLTLHDTSAGGTGKITGGNTPHGGGGVSVSNGGNLTMTGGSITGNAAYNGGGVNLQGGARFIMTGGTITGNTTKMGGGIYAMPEAAFTMTGGEISGNTATMGVGGVYVEGVYDEVAAAQMTVGGTARVTGNQASSGDNAIVSNVQLAPTAILTVSSSVPLAEGASISVRKSITSGATTADVTSTNDSDVSGYFTSDSDKRSIQNGTGNIVQLVAAPTYEAQWREQNDSAWTSGTLAEAVSFANTLPENYSKVAIIKLLNDVTTTQTLEFAERNTTTELDLNGKTIDANGGAFPVLTVRHNFVLGDDSTTDVTKQGKITGSNNTDGIGGGIAVEIGQGSIVTTDQWSFIIQGGNITGNTAKDGGGIGVDANCNFIMNGGNVSGNTATSNGGGIYFQNYIKNVINAGTITGNTAQDGGGVYVDASDIEIHGGEISENTATQSGGGVLFRYSGDKTFTMDKGIITRNTAVLNGGGVNLAGYAFIGGTANISGNHTTVDTVTTDNNLSCDEPLNIKPEPAEGFAIGVNVGNNKPTSNKPYSVTSTRYVYDTDISGYFSSDDSAYEIRYNATDKVVNLIVGPEVRWGEAKADGSAPDSGWVRGTFDEAVAYANSNKMANGTTYIQVLKDFEAGASFWGGSAILDLNGKTLTPYPNNLGIFEVKSNLTLQDTSTSVVANQGKITGSGSNVGGAVKILGGNFTMKGGQITGNAATYTGGGVYVGTDYSFRKGTFTMEGGAITNNTAGYQGSDNHGGGGVYVSGQCYFLMTGGTISGNTGYGAGGGVALFGNMQVGGTANISGNYRTAGTPSPSIDNVYLNHEYSIRVSTDTPLADGASISVRAYHDPFDMPTADKPFKITGANASNVSDYFHSDESNYSIENGTGNIVQLGLGSSTSGPPIITTTSLSNGVVGTAYGQTLEARGATPITWSLASSNLPAGLSLNATTGVISGTPTTAGICAFTVKATNSLGSDSKLLSITVTSPVTAVSVSPATATVKKTKTQQFIANVTAPDDTAKTVTWSVSGGTASSISTDGLLTVGGRETATTLTVKATSTVDSSKFGTAVVTVTAAPNIYSVTFDSDGGSAIEAVGNVEEGSAIKMPDPPTKENYRFDGWYTGKNGSGKQFTAATAVTASMTVYAKWTKMTTVSGIVVEEEGEAPVSGATITLSPTYGTTAVTTAADGKFSFTNIPEEYLTVTAVFADGSSMTVNVTDNHANIKIVKPKPYITIAGQPKDAYLIKGITGQSAVFRVETARVPHIPDVIACEWWWLKGNTPSGMAPDEKMSGSGNQMTFNASNENIPDRGIYKLYALAYTVDDVLLDTYSRVATLKVVGTNTIEGVVKKADGALVSGATVKLEYAGGAWPYGNVASTSSEVTQTTAADGAYKFELVPDGEYKLIITLPGGGEITYGPYDFPGPNPADPPEPIDPDIVIPDKAEIRVSGQPQDATVKNGTAVTLTVDASATDSTALTYQWYKSTKNSTGSGEAITAATANTYMPSTAEKSTAYYYCVVSGGSLASVTTRAAKVTVFTYGTIAGTVQTTSKQPIEGAKVELINIDTPVQTDFTTSTNPQTTLADGKYKFIEVPDGTYKLKITLPGTNGPVFVVEPIIAPNVNPDIPVTPPDKPTIRITSQPKNLTVALNDTAEFAVNAGVSNDGIVLYQWYSNTTNSTTGGTPIYGATENTYRAPTSTKGVAYYYCVMQSSGADSVTSNVAKLTVRNTSITNLMTIEGDVVDENGAKVTGAEVTLSPKAGTSENPQTTKADGHYKYENLPDGQYTITIKLPGGGVITEEIIISDGEITPTPPNNIEVPTTNSITITQQPKSIEVTTDMTASFKAKATATKAEVAYQWYKNTAASSSGGTKLDGETNETLDLGKQPEGVSYYYCVVSSTDATDATDATTQAATLTVTKATGGKGNLEGGIVNDENGDPVTDATVKLMKNGTDGIQFGSTVTTGEDGKFQFTDIPYGSYSLVAQKDTSTVTRQTTIKAASTTENLIMPSGAKVTKVMIGEDTPSTAVENLEAMFTDADNAIAQQTGATVEIRLVVEKQDSPSDKGGIDGALTENQEVGIYLDAKLVKVISGTVADDSTENIQPLSGQTLRIVIDLPESLWNKAPYQVIRSHTENGVTDVRMIIPDYDRELQTLSFDADAFSTYAIVYTQAPQYSVTVIGSMAGSSSGTGLYEAGATVTVQAGSKSGYSFDGWTTADGVGFASAGSATTSFTMPAKNVTVTASWKSNGGGNNSGGDDDGGDSDDPNNNITTGGGNNTPGGGTSNPGGGTSNPGGGNNTSGGGTSNPSGNNNSAIGEKAPENSDSSTDTGYASDLNETKDDALKQIADERQKAIDALPNSLTDAQRQQALDEIDRIYTKAIKDIQNLDSTEAIADTIDKTVNRFSDVVADVGGTMPTQATAQNAKPFVLLSAALAAAAVFGALLAWRRKEDEETDVGKRRRSRMIATAAAVVAILLFLLTTGWHGMTFANGWTAAIAVPASVSLFYALRHKKTV